MNELTKEEFEIIKSMVVFFKEEDGGVVHPKILEKLNSIIDSYCKHKISASQTTSNFKPGEKVYYACNAQIHSLIVPRLEDKDSQGNQIFWKDKHMLYYYEAKNFYKTRREAICSMISYLQAILDLSEME
jgi:hypothetical protein